MKPLFHHEAKTSQPAARKKWRSILDRPRIKAKLLKWFLRDGLSYGAAKARLQSEFDLKIGQTALFDFYHRHLHAKPASEESVITIRFTIRASGPVKIEMDKGDHQ